MMQHRNAPHKGASGVTYTPRRSRNPGFAANYHTHALATTPAGVSVGSIATVAISRQATRTINPVNSANSAAPVRPGQARFAVMATLADDLAARAADLTHDLARHVWAVRRELQALGATDSPQIGEGAALAELFETLTRDLHHLAAVAADARDEAAADAGEVAR